MNTNRKCLICQTEYYYCPSCEEARTGKKSVETWRVVAHDKNCRDILEILQRHSFNEYTDEEAKKLLEKCDLSAVDTAREATKLHVKKIMSVTSNAPKRVKKKPVISEEIVIAPEETTEVNTQN